MKIFKTLSKRGLALFLVLAMCMSLLPTTAMAAEFAEGNHIHNEDGWSCVRGELICGMVEHHHDESCYPANEPDTGDVDTPEEDQEPAQTPDDTQEPENSGENQKPAQTPETPDGTQDTQKPEETQDSEKTEAAEDTQETEGTVKNPDDAASDTSNGNQDTADTEGDTNILEAIGDFFGGLIGSLTQTLSALFEGEEPEQETTCGLPEHVHTDDCYRWDCTPPVTVQIPEDATEITPDKLLSAAYNRAMDMTAFFGLVQSSDVLGNNATPASITFVGEGVDATVKYEDAASSSAEISVGEDAITYNGTRVAVYAQGEAKVNDGSGMLTITGENTVQVSQQITLKSNVGSDTYNHQWESSDSLIATVQGSNNSATVTGVKKGTVTITHSYQTRQWNWSDFDYRYTDHTETFEVNVTVATNYTVTFDANGGTEGTMDSQTVSKLTVPGCGFTAPTTGKMFAGWNTAADGSGTAYAVGANVTLSEDLTLYAQWVDIPKVTFDLGGGTSSTFTPIDAVGGTVNLPKWDGTAPTGKQFKEWTGSDEKTYADEATITGLTSDLTLTAVYEDAKPADEKVPGRVYIYLKVSGSVDYIDWSKLNANGWFTVGYVDVSNLPDAKTLTNGQYYDTHQSSVIAQFSNVVFCPDTKGLFDLNQDSIKWTGNHTAVTANGATETMRAGLKVTKGADYYWPGDTDQMWHLDGFLEVTEKKTITVNFAVKDGHPQPDNFQSTSVSSGLQAMGATFSFTVPEYPGYKATCVENPSALTGSLTVGSSNQEYTIVYAKQQTVTFKPGDHGTFQDTTSTVEYGSAIPAGPATPGADNWTFTGWELTSGTVGPDNTVTDDLVYTAQWRQKTATYTVEYYYNGRLDRGKTETGTANVGDVISTYTDKNITGYKLEKTENLPLTLTTSGSNVIKVYYLEKFTVTYTDGVDDKEIFANDVHDVKYGDGVPATKLTEQNLKRNDGYKFNGWSPAYDATAKVTENKTYTAQWVVDPEQTHEVSYTVEYYKDDVLQDNDTQTKKQNVQLLVNTLTVDKTKINTTNKYQGYKLNATAPATIPDTVTNGTVIKVYYVKDSFGYTVEYYFDNELDSSKTVGTGEKAEYGTSILTAAGITTIAEADVKHGTPEQNYALDRVENRNGTITDDANNNVVKIFYALDANDDDTPDKYQATVTYKVTGGYWNAASQDDEDQGPYVLTLKEKDTNGVWQNVSDMPSMQVPEASAMGAKDGYTATGAGWKDDKEPPATASVDMCGQTLVYEYVYPARSDLTYTVKYLECSTDGTPLSPSVTVHEDATSRAYPLGATVELTDILANHKETISGFTYDHASLSEGASLTISAPATGANVVTLYYTRNSHKVTYEYDGTQPTGAPNVPSEISSVKFQETVQVAENLSFAGYTFSGWKKDGNVVTSFSMPDADVVLKGGFIANTAKIHFDTLVDGVTVESWVGVTDGATGKNALPTDQGNNPDLVRAGYTLEGWYAEQALTTKVTEVPTTFPAGETTYYAKWTANPVQYTVKYVTVENEQEKSIKAEETKTSTFDSVITVITTDEPNANQVLVPTIKGYKYTSEGSTTSLRLGLTGNVIKLYYTQDLTQQHEVKAQIEYRFGDTLEEAQAKQQADDTSNVLSAKSWIGKAVTLDVTNNIETRKYPGYNYAENATEGSLTYTLDINEDSPTDTKIVKVYYTKNDYSYTVEYYFAGEGVTNWDNATKGSPVVENTGKYNADIPYETDFANVNADNKPTGNYVFDHVELDETGNGKITTDAAKNVVKVYFGIDSWSEKNPEGTNPENPGDGIPDIHQAKVTYVVENGYWNTANSDEANKTYVLTLQEKNAEGVWQNVTEMPSMNVPAADTMGPKDGYTTDNGTDLAKWDTIPPNQADAIMCGKTYTFTYTYPKRTDLRYVVNYYLKDTDTKVEASTEVSSKTYLDEVTETALDLTAEGYKLAEGEQNSKTFKVGVGANDAFIDPTVINFYYTKRGDLGYTVKYFFNNVEVTATTGDFAVVKGTNGTLGEGILSEADITVASDVSYGDSHYALEKVVNKSTDGKITATETDNVVEIHYLTDIVKDPEKVDPENPDKPGDGIPDAYQAEVTYKFGLDGETVTGKWGDNSAADKYYVLNWKERNAAGELVNVTAPEMPNVPGMSAAAGYQESTKSLVSMDGNNAITDNEGKAKVPEAVIPVQGHAYVFTWKYLPQVSYTIQYHFFDEAGNPITGVSTEGLPQAPTTPVDAGTKVDLTGLTDQTRTINGVEKTFVVFYGNEEYTVTRGAANTFHVGYAIKGETKKDDDTPNPKMCEITITYEAGANGKVSNATTDAEGTQTEVLVAYTASLNESGELVQTATDNKPAANVTATADAGYNEDGWRKDAETASLSLEDIRKLTPTTNTTFTAQFTTQKNLKYTVKYYFDTAESSEWTLAKEVEGSGEFNTEIPFKTTFEEMPCGEGITKPTGNYIKVKVTNANDVIIENAKITATETNNVVKVYFGIDTMKVPETPEEQPGDNIADRYQTKVIFEVDGGEWNEGKAPVQSPLVVTLRDAEGNLSETGSYTLKANDIPEAGSKPDATHRAAKDTDNNVWGTNAPVAGTTEIKKTGTRTFTYTYPDRMTMTVNASGIGKVYDGMASTITVTVKDGDIDLMKDPATKVEFFATKTGDMLSGPIDNSFTNVVDKTVYIRVTHPDYTTVDTTAVVSITRKPVTVTADNQRMAYGANLPQPLTAKMEGTIGTDTVSFNVTCALGPTTPAGVYPGSIVATGDATQGNYSVTFVPGTLTITAADRPAANALIVTPYVGTYDAIAHGVTVSVAKLPGDTIEYSLDGTTGWTETAPAATNVTAQPVPVYVRVTNPNYNTATGNSTITIKPKAVTVTADNQEMVYSGTEPKLTATVKDNLNNDVIDYTLTRAPGTNVGEYAINVTGEEVQGNYTVTFNPGTLTIKGQVSYDANAGTDTVEGMPGKSKKVYALNEEIPHDELSDAEPVRTNYTFAGWSLTAGENNTVLADADKVTMGETGVTLYAVWTQNTYTVKVNYQLTDDGVEANFEPYAGSDVTSSAVVGYPNGWSVMVSQVSLPGATITAPWTIKNGEKTYVQDNLASDKDVSGLAPEYSGANTTVECTLVYALDTNGNLIPDYQERFTLTYDANGGVGKVPVDDAKYAQNAKATLATSTELTKGEAVFLGWSLTKHEDLIKSVEAKEKAGLIGEVTFEELANITVYAVWAEDKNGNGTPDYEDPHYTVTYTDGVDGEEVFKDQVHENVLVDLATPAFVGTPVRAKYVFAGWEPVVADTVTKDVTYAAQWMADKLVDPSVPENERPGNGGDGIPDDWQVTVTFGAVNGTVSFDDTVVTKRNEITLKPDANGRAKLAQEHIPATRANTGYTGGTWAPMTPVAGLDVTDMAGTIARTADKTFTITYERIVNTITIEVVNGTASASSIYVLYGENSAPITFSGNEGYVLGSATVDGAPVELTNGMYTFYGVVKDHTIRVVYAQGTFTATFVDGQTGDTIETRSDLTTLPAESTYPAAPEHEGYDFTGWTVTGPDANGNYTITAHYEPAEVEDETFTVIFTDGLTGETIEERPGIVELPDEGAYPAAPEHEGYDFIGWTVTGPDADGNYTITANYVPVEIPVGTHTVTWVNWNGVQLQQVVVNDGDAEPDYTGAAPVRPSDTAYTYTFRGWSAPVVDADGNVTYTAQYTPSAIVPEGPDVPVGPTEPTTPTTPTTPPTVIPDNPAPLAPPTTTITDQDVPLAGAIGLNDVDHFAYVIGYDDDTVRPLNNITRAEVATIFFRLMTDEYRTANWATTNDFSDVKAGSWYNNAISTCAKAGLLTGYPDGTFKPNQSITRAEFAAIAARFLSDEVTGENVGDFSDTANHWAAKEIRRAAEAGWVTGSNNEFRPNDKINRAEVMTIVNRMLDRIPDAEHMLETMKKWTDNPEGTWYYEAVQEATNEHAYERDELGVTETWTEILEARDWKALEAEWASANAQ